MNFSKIFWGSLFLILGVILLGINFGWWNNDIWRSLANLWPIILIILGISIAFGQSSPVSLILLAVVLLCSIAYLAKPIHINDRFIEKEGLNTSVETRDYTYEKTSQVERSTLSLNLGAANINVGALPDNTLLYAAKFQSDTDLSIGNNLSGDDAIINMSENFSGFNNFRNIDDRRLDLSLNSSTPFSLKIDSGASKINLGLKDLIVGSLQVNAGASTQEIEIGSGSDLVKVKLDAGASKIKLRLPKEFSLKITNDSGLLKNNFSDLGLDKKGNVYANSDFESNPKKIEIEVRAGASSISLEKY